MLVYYGVFVAYGCVCVYGCCSFGLNWVCYLTVWVIDLRTIVVGIFIDWGWVCASFGIFVVVFILGRLLAF